jgi:hypothetical protein
MLTGQNTELGLGVLRGQLLRNHINILSMTAIASLQHYFRIMINVENQLRVDDLPNS